MNIIDIIKEFLKFIPAELYVLVASLLVLGVIIKNTNLIKDEFIPVALILFSIFSTILYSGISIESVWTGINCTGLAILLHQAYKQSKKLKE